MVKACFGPYVLDSGVPELRKGNTPVSLEPQVLDLLAYLLEHRDRIISKDELVEAVWEGRIVSDATITTRINAVRQAVGDSGHEQKTIRTFPKRGFRFVAPVDDADNSTSQKPSMSASSADESTPSEASILVIPFADLSPGGSDFLAEGLSEDLIVALSRHHDVSVIAINSALKVGEGQDGKGSRLDEIAATYLVTGAVRTAGDRLRVTVQLSQKATGQGIWSESFDRRIEDLFQIQDDIVQAIAGRLPWRVLETEGRRASASPTPSLSTYQSFVRAYWESDKHGDIHRTEHDLRAVVNQDPSFAPAQAELGFLLGYKVLVTGQQTEQDIEQSLSHARAALHLADDNERVLAKSAMVFQFAGQYSLGLSLSQKAIDINPNSTDCTHFRATILGASGDADAAVKIHEKTRMLDPLFPERHYEGMMEANYLLGRYEDALALFDRWSDPLCHIYAFAAACCAMLGQHERAKTLAARFEEMTPPAFDNAVFVEAMLRYHLRDTDRLHWLNGFDSAGISGMDTVRKSDLLAPR